MRFSCDSIKFKWEAGENYAPLLTVKPCVIWGSDKIKFYFNRNSSKSKGYPTLKWKAINSIPSPYDYFVDNKLTVYDNLIMSGGNLLLTNYTTTSTWDQILVTIDL